jgi:poly(3-hydroxybutyrate) depolymerase
VSRSGFSQQAPPAAPAQAAAPGQDAAAPASDGKQEFIDSLSLRPTKIISDSTLPSIVWLTQNSQAAYRPAGAVKIKLSLFAEPAPQAAGGRGAAANPQIAADAKPVKELGVSDVYPRDIVQKPAGISIDATGVPDGNYRLVGEIIDGDAALTKVDTSIWLAAGIDAKYPAIRARLDKIQGHESTKASILYPFDFARVINIGRRNYNAADIGINEQRLPNYKNFAQLIKTSETLLSELESGKDSLWQSKGDNNRHYYFAEGDEVMPYRVIVPKDWDGKSQLPLVFILHGDTRDQDFYSDRSQNLIPKAAEKYKFMLVSVFGYHPNGGYNDRMLQAGARGGAGGGRAGGGRGGAGGGAASFGAAAGGGGRGGRGGGFMNGMPQARLAELSEIDTMHVYDLIHKEYPIDAKRTYLFGYSHGGNGGYYIAGKYADNWAGVALGGAGNGPNVVNQYFETFKSKQIPFMIYFGDQDGANVQSGSRAMVDAMKEAGIEAVVKSYPGVDHDHGPEAGAADAFAFFDAHRKR